VGAKVPVRAIFREYFEAIAAAICLALFCRLFVVSVLYLPEANMEPGLLKGDFVIGWKLAYGLRIPMGDGKRLNAKAPERGDVISFRFPGDEEQILIRRLIGLPGDEIQIKDGLVLVNGRALEQKEFEGEEAKEVLPSGKSYRIRREKASVEGSEDHNATAGDDKRNVDFEAITVPEKSFFVLADNRQTSDDSRAWGFVSEAQIISRLGLIWLSMNTKKGAFEPRWSRVFQTVK